MHSKSILATAYALIAVTILLVHEPGFSQPAATEAAQPEEQRICSKDKDAVPGPSVEQDQADAQSLHQPPSKPVQADRPRTELATFGMGCFWGAEADFCVVDGVVATTVGYAGGHTRNPGYRQVSSGMTGHAEVVQVEYDPSRVSYTTLLDVFWTQHDPTTPNRQGPDVGTQYRSLILFHSPEQERTALDSKQRYATAFRQPIVTRIAPATTFYPAEGYHQDYLERRGRVRCRD